MTLTSIAALKIVIIPHHNSASCTSAGNVLPNQAAMSTEDSLKVVTNYVTSP